MNRHFSDEKDDTLASVNGTNRTVTIMKFLIFQLNIPFFFTFIWKVYRSFT